MHEPKYAAQGTVRETHTTPSQKQNFAPLSHEEHAVIFGNPNCPSETTVLQQFSRIVVGAKKQTNHTVKLTINRAAIQFK